MARRVWTSVASLVTILALGGCGGSPSAPDGAATGSVAASEAKSDWIRTRTTFPDGTFTACDKEPFSVTTVVDTQQHTTTRPAGDWVLTHHTTVSADGVGTISGARYVGRGTVNDTQVLPPPHGAAFTFTSVVRMRNLVQGSADNDVVEAQLKWVRNAKGELTVFRPDLKTECRG